MPRPYHGYMALLIALTRAFINTFGITQPSPAGERRAAYFIGTLLALVIIGTAAALIAFLMVRR